MKMTPNLKSKLAPQALSITKVTLQAGLDAANDLQLYTYPGGLLIDHVTIKSGTEVSLKDFTGWTVDASHVEGTAPIAWSRDENAGQAFYVFQVTSTIEFEVLVEASNAAATKTKTIYIKVKPATTPGLVDDVNQRPQSPAAASAGRGRGGGRGC
jgi:hypothetical protein